MNFFWSSEKQESGPDISEELASSITELDFDIDETKQKPIRPTSSEIDMYLKTKLYKNVLTEMKKYIYPDMNISFNCIEEYDEVVKEINEVLKPDMNIFFIYHEEYDKVVKEIKTMLRPDMNLYELMFNIVLEELIDEYSYDYISIKKDPRYDQIVFEFKKCYWAFKFNTVLSELLDSVYTIDKFSNTRTITLPCKQVQFLINFENDNTDDKMPPELTPLHSRGRGHHRSNLTSPITSYVDQYVVMGFTSNEFCILGLFESIDEIKLNKDMLSNFAKNIKLPYTYRIIKTKRDNFDNTHAFITFTNYEDNPYMSYTGSIILDDVNYVDFAVYLEFL